LQAPASSAHTLDIRTSTSTARFHFKNATPHTV
jgi:hypothetical protein